MNRLANRLTQQLHRFYPQVLSLSSSADEPWIWALLKLAPDPGKVRRLSTRRVDRILAAHRIRRISGSEVVDILKTTPLYVAPGTVEAATAHIDLLLPQLAVVHEQRVACSKRIDALLERLTTDGENGEHRDVNILRSLPGVGRSVAATMLAEASQPLAERDYHALRTYAGTAPVTKRSGKRITVKMRRGCSHRLRNAVYHWARISAQHDPNSRAIYQNLRKRGHTHGRALRSLADRLIRILVAMLRTRTLYDATRLPKLAVSGALQ
jgi:transposase